MFGYIQANMDALSEEEKKRYKSLYCGLCHSIGDAHGQCTRLGLSYDMVFIALLLSALYEPENECGEKRCAIHPAKKHPYEKNKYTEYAADMMVALMYHNLLDDWNDDRKLLSKAYADVIKKKYTAIKEKWSYQCSCIEKEIEALSDIEKRKVKTLDDAANCSGRLIASVITPHNDMWTPYLRNIGFGVGKFIYLADAACDFDSDKKKGSYNPLVLCDEKPENMRPMLTQILGKASESLEKLPIVDDAHLLSNILYSGIWIKYNQKMKKKGAAK